MNNHEQIVFDSAMNFIRTNLPSHLPGHEPKLVDNCMEFLQARHSLPARQAEHISHTALAEVQSRKSGLIDIGMSNSYVVFLRDTENQCTYAFSAATLKTLIHHGTVIKHA